jgi:hypothetical protein
VLIIVLLVSFSLLFSMRNFASRQQLVADGRQTARRAVDYMSYYVRGASDGNTSAGMPNSLVMWTSYKSGGSYTPYQVSFDNMTQGGVGAAAWADPFTDVISLSFATGARTVPISRWVGGAHSENPDFDFRDGCPPPYGNYPGGSDTLNMQKFMALTGCQGTCNGSFPTGNAAVSSILTLVATNPACGGRWTYFVITGYMRSDCADAGNPVLPLGDPNATVIETSTSPGRSNGINPPSGHPDMSACKPAIGGAIQMYCFRVKNRQLQQKAGIFDPTGQIDSTHPDNSDAQTLFQPLLDNVEDFQVAYIFDNGQVWNREGNRLATTGAIPEQNQPASTTTDITRVIGLRLTVVARSNQPVPRVQLGRNKYPLVNAEDHVWTSVWTADAADPDRFRFFRNRLTATIMLRNRMPGD